MNALEDIGNRIAARRESLGWTQQRLSQETGINVMAISHYECHRREPNLLNLKSICHALGVTANYLLGLE